MERVTGKGHWQGEDKRTPGIIAAMSRSIDGGGESEVHRNPSLLLEPGGDLILVVPPFAIPDRPSLAAHVLQERLARRGRRLDVLYANLWLAAEIGVEDYLTLCFSPTESLLGERLFARWAHGLASMATDRGLRPAPSGDRRPGLSVERLCQIEEALGPWVERVAQAVAELGAPIVGCTTSFEQTNASLSILDRLSSIDSGIVTLLGGANCEGPMAEGLASLAPGVDYVFSGESESTLPDLVERVLSGERPTVRVRRGQPVLDLDRLGTPDFSQFFDQFESFLPREQQLKQSVRLPYETSRGCWWGEKSHCTFCGLNGESMAFRCKSPDTVVRDLTSMVDRTSVREIFMVDNIMPHSYHSTLLPRLSRVEPLLQIFYELKSNLTHEQLKGLVSAGVRTIQPGIEAVDSELLRLMKKGVSARQNLALLRSARSLGMDVRWNLLWGFPGDRLESYERTLAMVPLLQHLQPPTGLCHLSIDRFSPYFERAAEHGISRLGPMSGYRRVFPDGADLDTLAYHFEAEYEAASHRHPEVLHAIEEAVEAWRGRWEVRSPDASRPRLRLLRRGGELLLEDSRATPGEPRVVDFSRARSAVLDRPYQSEAGTEWALDHGYGVVSDHWYVSLVTVAPGLMESLC